MFDYDLVVVGGGSAGLTAAKFAADLQARVLLVEKRKVLGGDCTWFGCVPSKALISAGHATWSNAAFGPKLTGDVSSESVAKFVDETRRKVYSLETPAVLAEEGVEVVFGEAVFDGPRSLRVGDRKISFFKLVLCTGSSPAPLDVGGDYDTNETIFDKPPASGEKLAVVGSGPIGAELAQACARLGADVTIFGRRGLVPRERPDARKVVERAFNNENIKVVQAAPVAIEPGVLKTKDAQYEFDRLLIAVGRAPVVPETASALGVEIKKGFVVDKHMACRGNKHVYAAGDCLDGGPQFTHVAGFQGYVAARNALLPGREAAASTLDIAQVPRVTYTDPEVGAVGLADVESAARVLKLPANRIATIKWNSDKNDRAVTDREDPEAFVELVVALSADASKATIVGGSAVSHRAGEILSEIAVAAKNKLTTAEVARTMHPYPTFAFVLQQMCGQDAQSRFLHNTRLGRYFVSSYKKTKKRAASLKKKPPNIDDEPLHL